MPRAAAVAIIDNDLISFYTHGKKSVTGDDLVSQDTIFEIGSITNEDVCFKPNQRKCEVNYTYEVNHVEHNGTYVFDNQSNDTICVKKGDRFEIEYAKLNPKRSILHLDKPDIDYCMPNPMSITFYHDDKKLDELHAIQLKEDSIIKKNAIQNKFKGHLAGIEFGYATVKNSPFLDQNLTRKGLYEMSLNIWFYDYKFPIYKEYLGITTGIGLSDLDIQISNNQDIYRNHDSVWGQKNVNTSYKHNVLEIGYISIPVMLELNSNPNPKKTFYCLAGLIGGVKLYTAYYKSKNSFAVGEKSYSESSAGDIGLNYFKLDASIRMGYKNINFYANYALTPLFNSHLTSAVYPFSLGVSFVFNL